MKTPKIPVEAAKSLKIQAVAVPIVALHVQVLAKALVVISALVHVLELV